MTAPAPLAVVDWCQANGLLQEAELVSLIVVAKVSGTTRRCSLEMGTLRRPCSGMGLRTRRAFHAASIGGRPVMPMSERVARVYPSAPFVYAIHIERWHSSRVPAYCREGWPVDFDGIRRGQLPGRLWAEPCSGQARRVPRRVRGWCKKAQEVLSLGNFNRRVAGGPERIDTNIHRSHFLDCMQLQ